MQLFLRQLSNYTTDPNEKHFLNILASPQGKDEYDNIFFKSNKNILDILKALPSCNPPFTVLLEHLPRLMPRPYSIASSPLKISSKIRIIFSLSGLTTNYLESKINSISNRCIRFYFRTTNNFRYDNIKESNNLIMISAGTGIAPFVGFIEHVAEQMENSKKNIWLLTGYRYRERNNLLYDLFQKWLDAGVLNKLSQAFSRDETSQYKYVQDQIKCNSIQFIELIKREDTSILICGDAKTMIPDVEKIISECLMTVEGMEKEASINFIDSLRKSGRYLEDKWI